MEKFSKIFGFRDDDDAEIEDTAEETKNVSPVPGKARRQFYLAKPDMATDEVLFEIAEHLLNRESVILNLELIAKDSRRFVDFLSGVVFALQGSPRKVAPTAFLFTPGGVEISGEIPDLSDPGMNF